MPYLSNIIILSVTYDIQLKNMDLLSRKLHSNGDNMLSVILMCLALCKLADTTL